MPSEQPAPRSDRDRAALASIGADVSAFCVARLARVAGTHGLQIDGMPMPAPAVTGVACWTGLQPAGSATRWQGSLQADLAELPFADDSFSAVLARFTPGLDPACATELARVLAPHGTLLIAGLHPRSLWHRGVAPGRWERALRATGLDVIPAVRCGAPWPRPRGAEGLPHWLTLSFGGAWVVEARRSVLATLPLRKPASLRAVEHNTLLPGAHRECA
ncbi:MAG: hypothetical protein EPN36_03245 [Rhodanobacteraceae bacterium]|nr:MAG: hypothetical protein EPN36_03245 [Rhodanobacteraceae bacterium]